MAVTAAMVKELREMTGAGMMDCKKALAATDGDMDKAVEFLREKGGRGRRGQRRDRLRRQERQIQIPCLRHRARRH